MAAKALKQWALSEDESITSFEAWKNNLIFILGLDDRFQPFLVQDLTWRKHTKACKNRGFTGKDADVHAMNLELMLGQIANFAPIMSRNTIIKNSTSLNSIWESIRLYYGILSNGARFVDFLNIKARPDKRPEALYQEITSFIEDNLMKPGNGLTHHGAECDEEEEVSPSFENLLVLLWLQMQHPELPNCVRERFGTELRKQTLASLRTEISQCIPSLLASLEGEDSRIRLSRARFQSNRQSSLQRSLQRSSHQSTIKKRCPLCKAAKKPDYHHYLSECPYLPEEDRRYIGKQRKPKSRTITVTVPISDSEESENEDPDFDESSEEQDIVPQRTSTTRRVDTKLSPTLKAFHKHNAVTITLDTGAEVTLVRHQVAHFLGLRLKNTSQTAYQADGVTPLHIVGETSFTVSAAENTQLQIDALVVTDIDVDILAGMPFMMKNDITVRPAKYEIILKGSVKVHYKREPPSNSRQVSRHIKAQVMRVPAPVCVYPGDYLELDLPDNLASEEVVAVEPRITKAQRDWPVPTICSTVNGRIRLVNGTSEPQAITKHEHFCQVLPVVNDNEISNTQDHPYDDIPVRASIASARSFSDDVSLDPDNIMTPAIKTKFVEVLKQHDAVFDPKYPGYNGHHGNFKAVVNMGPVLPPQRKGRIPQYSRDKLVQLQQVFDKLENKGVFKTPEEAGITVEYLNPSFLVKKSSGGFRLVTAFSDVGRYCKPSPSTMPDIDSTLRTIATWSYIIVTDLTSAFYQIPLEQESMKYCGVATPFKGIRVYQRAAMGMPGSETALEEMMCRVLGPQLQDGTIAKLADDLFCGGNTLPELLDNFTRLLEALKACNLRLSSKKTVICPKSTTILGWIWQEGSISASPHRISTLSQAQTPTTVKAMKSFIGAYKFLGRVLPGCAAIIAPLDEAIAGLQSHDKLTLSDDLLKKFKDAQDYLSNHKSITLPRPSDRLWIVTDASVRCTGVGGTLYISRNDKLLLAGFFSIKLKKHQSKWLPCEIEALGIASSINHFAPYITQSQHRCCILTDSKPCVQAFAKLCRGEFSQSPRVATFISTASRYHVSIQHLSGSVNVPSDFASRNAPECTEPSCQVCSFAKQIDESVVRNVAVSDVVSGKALPPFSNKRAWLSLQMECSDLRRTQAHLKQGTRPSKKVTDAHDVKRYLNVVTLNKDGLIVVKKNEPLTPSQELIVVPRILLPGLLTALHISLDHPSAHQLKQVADRMFFALNMASIVKEVTSNCHTCLSLQAIPKYAVSQSSCDPPSSVGQNFAADVVRLNRQMIFVMRETVTSYTATYLLENETKDNLRTALICSCVELRPLNCDYTVVRVDGAPGFTGLQNDKILSDNHIKLEIGCVKNPNKNPVAERAIQELEEELLRCSSVGKAVTPLLLATDTARLNSRIRSRGLSSREMLLQREQFNNTQIPVSDQALIDQQHQSRLKNHKFSERSKFNVPPISQVINPGDLVFLKSDRSKSHARERYIVLTVDDETCKIKKLNGSRLRCESYVVKKAECMPITSFGRPTADDEPADTEDQVNTEPAIPIPQIPDALTVPAPAYAYSDDSDIKDGSEPETVEEARTPRVRPRRNRRAPAYLANYELE